jgi:hypothetical protein
VFPFLGLHSSFSYVVVKKGNDGNVSSSSHSEGAAVGADGYIVRDEAWLSSPSIDSSLNEETTSTSTAKILKNLSEFDKTTIEGHKGLMNKYLHYSKYYDWHGEAAEGRYRPSLLRSEWCRTLGFVSGSSATSNSTTQLCLPTGKLMKVTNDSSNSSSSLGGLVPHGSEVYTKQVTAISQTQKQSFEKKEKTEKRKIIRHRKSRFRRSL